MAENPSPEPTPADAPKVRPPFNELSVLFPLLSLYTAGYLGLMLADFMLKQTLDLPDGIMPVYIALLGAYAADKEIRRWLVTPEPPRKGSLFVYLWLLFFLVAYIIRTFQPAYELPANLVPVCLQVLGIFFGSKASKYVWEKRWADPASLGELRRASDGGRQAVIMDMIKAKGQITRRDVMDKLSVSDNTVNRLLQGLENRQLVKRMGEGRGSYYVMP